MSFAATTACTFSTSQLQKWSDHGVFCYILTSKVCFAPQTACTFSRSELPKVVRTPSVFDIFDFEMCFAPQRRALFGHLNSQKWSERGVFCTFSLRNVLRATTACNFSSLIWPAGSAPAALASLLLDPPEPQIIGKNTVFRDFPTFFAHLNLLSSDSFSFDLLSSNLSLLSGSALLCFSSVHIVGSLTSKLPSIKCIFNKYNDLIHKKINIGFVKSWYLRYQISSLGISSY